MHKSESEKERHYNKEHITNLEAGKKQYEKEKKLRDGAMNKSDDNKKSRKMILNRLYGLTGNSKIPTLVHMLIEWIQDKTKGKLCIFAHHLYMLDEIVNRSGLSNRKGSLSKYIRIDGSTNPISRQEQILKFQTDPTVRIAVLGITAAGVAVTLTAASTVWFSELFWTPGVLIQAEDRCHRIGQQAVVNVLYFIANGTLDEILWKLVEKKFSDLAEFVEGKDNEKLVVHRTYDGIADFRSQNESHIIEIKKEFQNSLINPAEDETLISDFADEMLIQNDITELGKEEQCILTRQSNDSNPKNCDLDEDNTFTKIEFAGREEDSKKEGETETDAICLSDDEEDDVIEETPQFSMLSKKIRERKFTRFSFPTSMQVSNLRFYTMFFQGLRYGINLIHFERRVVVCSLCSTRIGCAKPAVGDILLSINDIPIVWNAKFGQVTNLLLHVLKNPPVKLLFGEEKEFSSFFEGYLKILKQKKIIKANDRQSETIDDGQSPAVQSNLNDKTSQNTSEVNTVELVDDE
eukprot:CAMPEP_0197837522 /NCGR_PEP_ID=MMETSP1437-20131217/32385_1 /TAXON_ID=49252 ORGANISM="Eucampia antarctica, Strain CCMP1452" /NCGR_SAMPLE_ID=MMETSP1437 /ASSEMBLY_ACC=CAM_ASM_001096 /LENGTH=519 /DNA_ID=CAMNT_0043444617 /DNA_START=83 /DNA_END=1642 /DNA_ORIENTATION=+